MLVQVLSFQSRLRFSYFPLCRQAQKTQENIKNNNSCPIIPARCDLSQQLLQQTFATPGLMMNHQPFMSEMCNRFFALSTGTFMSTVVHNDALTRAMHDLPWQPMAPSQNRKTLTDIRTQQDLQCPPRGRPRLVLTSSRNPNPSSGGASARARVGSR